MLNNINIQFKLNAGVMLAYKPKNRSSPRSFQGLIKNPAQVSNLNRGVNQDSRKTSVKTFLCTSFHCLSEC